MRKNALIMIITGLILVSCNMPNNQNPTNTPNADAVATQVRALLTAQPSPNADAVATQVRVLLTAQPSPTIQATIKPLTPTAVATSTQSIMTSTTGPTQTTSPEDPKMSLGDPVWKNTFDTGKGFGLETPYEDENIRFAVENGALVMTGMKANGWHSWRLTSPKVQDFYLEATTRTGNCSGSDLYGLVVRAPDFDSGKGYYYGVTCDGRYTFGKWQEQGILDIINLTQNAAIQAGSNQTNRLGIKTDGNHISLYANGKLLQETEDNTFESSGNFGVWLAANKTAGFTVQIDEMDYWKLR